MSNHNADIYAGTDEEMEAGADEEMRVDQEESVVEDDALNSLQGLRISWTISIRFSSDCRTQKWNTAISR